ncbi:MULTISPECIES: hypothetical protein [Bradyrhizobium]|nr:MULTISPECIES: hypothetical protein [Bradyrhizobium]
MTWSPGTAGSKSRPAPAVPSRLASAIAISVTIGALSLCVEVTMAMPLST